MTLTSELVQPSMSSSPATYGIGTANATASSYTSLFLFGVIVPIFLIAIFHRCTVERRNRLLPRILLGFVVLVQVTSCIAGFLAMTIANWFVPHVAISEDSPTAQHYQLKDTITTSLKSICYRISDKMPYLTKQCEPLCSAEPFVSRFSLRAIISGRGGCGVLHVGAGLFAFGLVLGMALVAALFIRSDTLSDFLQYFSSPDDTDRIIGYHFGSRLKANSREGRILRRKLVAQAHAWLAGITSFILLVGLGLITRWNRHYLGFHFDTSYGFAVLALMTQIVAFGLYVTRHAILPASLAEWTSTKSGHFDEDDDNDDQTEDEEEEDEEADDDKSSSRGKKGSGKTNKSKITTDDIIDLDLEDGVPRNSKGGMLQVSDDDSDNESQKAGSKSGKYALADDDEEEGYTTDFDDDFYSAYRKSGQSAFDASASLAFAISKALGIDEDDSDTGTRSKKGKKKKKKGKKSGDLDQPRRGSFLKANPTGSEVEDFVSPEPIRLTRTQMPTSPSTSLPFNASVVVSPAPAPAFGVAPVVPAASIAAIASVPSGAKSSHQLTGSTKPAPIHEAPTEDEEFFELDM